MKVDYGILGKLTRLLVILVFLAAAAVVVATYWPLLEQNNRMREVVYTLDQQIQQEQAKERQFKSSIIAISTDPKTVERLAREKLGYARPGEKFVVFE